MTIQCTQFYRIKGGGGSWRPPPPPPPPPIIYRWKENLTANRIHFKYLKDILISRFYEQFSRNGSAMAPERTFEKISNLKIMNILYISLKHVVWRFRVYNYFREIFKFRENMSKNRFREISLSVNKIAKFDYFAKVIIYSKSPDHVL